MTGDDRALYANAETPLWIVLRKAEAPFVSRKCVDYGLVSRPQGMKELIGFAHQDALCIGAVSYANAP